MTLPKTLRWPFAFTYAGLIAERITQAAWPLWTVMFAGLALWGLGGFALLPTEVLWVCVLALSAGVVYGLWYARRLRFPHKVEALERLDASLPGRPIQALADHPTIGAGDTASMAVWTAHLARMEEKLKSAQAVEPDLRVARADPYALRYMAVLGLALALLFGGAWRGSDLAAGLGAGAADALPAGPAWEAWFEPPRYTGKPTLYLPDIDPGAVEVPQGTRVTLRLYGQVGALAVTQTLTETPLPDPSAVTQDFEISRPGSLTIAGGEADLTWNIVMLADTAPDITADAAPSTEPPDQMLLPFTVLDDYGMELGQAVITRDLAGTDRRHGLAIAPDPRAPLELSLPLPISGDRADFSETLIEDVSKHPFADLPVSLTLEAEDALGQVGRSDTMRVVLPGRGFFDPLANALVEQRRDLLWARANSPRVAQILRTLTYRADDTFSDPSAFILVRMAIRRLEANPDLTPEMQDDIAEVLWQAALRIEEGTLDNALEQLRRAQERLSEAIRQGADEAEIDQLMQELREAMDNYMRELAQEAMRNPDSQQQGQNQQGEREEITQDQLDQLLDRIEELMREGRTAEAQQLLQELQQMMENMQMTQGQGGEGQQGEGEQAMNELRDTLREQQGLSDDSFQNLQEQFGEGGDQQGQQPGNQQGQGQQPGQQGQSGQQGQQQGQGQGQQSGEGQGQQQGQGQGQQPGQQPGEGQGQGQPGQGQGQGQGQAQSGSPTADDLARRQEALRDQVERLERNLPGQGTEAGEAARDALGRAGRAMGNAAEALENGDLPGAIDDQAQAMDALREGMQNLGEAMAQEQQQGQGQQGTEFGENGAPQQQDPLGRNQGTTGRLGTDEGMLGADDPRQRSRELMDEIRRRSAEQERPENERDYLNRLLDRF